jgi:ribosomal protein S14
MAEALKKGKRKTISLKVRAEVLKRDNYTCRKCGRSPAIYRSLFKVRNRLQFLSKHDQILLWNGS